jgi:hypothetical protein
MLEREFKYYRDHQQELAPKYTGKYIVIVGEEVVGDYNSEIEAYNAAKKKYELGTFLIQLCSPDPNTLTQTFHSRVYFIKNDSK